LRRRNLTDAQRVQLALRLKPVAQAKAKERQKEHGGTTHGKKSLPQILGGVKEATEEVAEAAGVSAETVRKVERVNAKATPELRAAMNANAVTINTAGAVFLKSAEPERFVRNLTNLKSLCQKSDEVICPENSLELSCQTGHART
jgi:transcriptional regulator with XRE-family HTH domain